MAPALGLGTMKRRRLLHTFSDRLDFQPQPHQQFNTLVWRMKWKD